MPRLQPKFVLSVLSLLLLASTSVALFVGPAGLGPVAVWQALWTAESNNGLDPLLVVWQLRFPRIVLCLLIGASLALSGAVMQGLFRNPLADPSIIGVTSGASLGASIAIVGGSYLLLPGLLAGLSALTIGAFVGGLCASALVYRLASSTQGTSVATMLLLGIAITALAGAVNNALSYFVDNEMLRRMSLWRMGGLEAANWPRLSLALPLLLPILLYLPRQAVALNVLLLGESEARHLGIAVEALKRRLIVAVALAVAVCVALSGAIAFVGLVVPHMLRLILGPDHRALLPASALGGALLLLVADTLARTLVSPAEMPVGILTALLGAPIFVSLLRQKRWQL